MKITNKKITELKPYEDNPRINDHAVEAVANSIKEFGFKVPCVIDKNGVIVAGHTRVKAAKKLGIKTVPCVIADDLTEEQVKAFRLADNKTAEIAEWDFDKLAGELGGCLDFNMADFGFEDSINEVEIVDPETVSMDTNFIITCDTTEQIDELKKFFRTSGIKIKGASAMEVIFENRNSRR